MRMVSTIRWEASTDAFVLERTDASAMERAHRRWGEAELQRASQLQGGTVGIADLQRRSKYLLKRRRLMEQRTAAAAAAPPTPPPTPLMRPTPPLSWLDQFDCRFARLSLDDDGERGECLPLPPPTAPTRQTPPTPPTEPTPPTPPMPPPTTTTPSTTTTTTTTTQTTPPQTPQTPQTPPTTTTTTLPMPQTSPTPPRTRQTPPKTKRAAHPQAQSVQPPPRVRPRRKCRDERQSRKFCVERQSNPASPPAQRRAPKLVARPSQRVQRVARRSPHALPTTKPRVPVLALLRERGIVPSARFTTDGTWMLPTDLGAVKGDGVLQEPKRIAGLYGGGGGDLAGAADAGIKVSFWTDAAAVCRRTIVAAHPHLDRRAVVADMEDDAAVESVVTQCGDIAIVSGGPLCKGMSPMNVVNHGTKKYDNMNNHVLRFVDVALRLNARVIVLENSAALGTQLKFRKLLTAAVRELRSAGYFVSVNVLNFKNYKVPNRGASG